jgi:hypothetical protein
MIMKKNTAHKILNPILLVLIANQATTALLRDQIGGEAFEFIHEGGGILLVSLVIVHLILNFSWVKASYFSK